MYSSTLPSIPALHWAGVVSTTPRPLYPRERPDTHCTGSWVGHRAGLDGCGIRSPDRPARIKSLYRLSYRGPFLHGRYIMQNWNTSLLHNNTFYMLTNSRTCFDPLLLAIFREPVMFLSCAADVSTCVVGIVSAVDVIAMNITRCNV
jgi:hypothetical protein